MKNEYALVTPDQTARELADKSRQLRLEKRWKQATLAERSGVSLASLRRFEGSGLVSLQNLLKLAFALGRLEDFISVLQPRPAGSIDELEKNEASKKIKRGSK